MIPRPRRGFALLVVLWVLVGASALGLTLGLSGRHAVRAATNRRELARARWSAEGCIALARAILAEAGWRELDAALARSPALMREPCRLTLQPTGVVLDVNAADAEILRALFARLRLPAPRADSLVEALSKYRRAHGPLGDIRELRHVQGYEAISGLDSLLGVEPGRLEIDRAPLPALGALPGIGDEALAVLRHLRARRAEVRSLISLTPYLSAPARELLMAHLGELERLTTTDPDSWTLTARSSAGTPPVTAVVAVRLVRVGERIALVQRRMWIE